MKKSSHTQTHRFRGHHRFEHWYADNQVYFVTARCRDRSPAFATEPAKAIFWDRFTHYTKHFDFTTWITSLLDNHYHTMGYLKLGQNLGPMMQRLHGSVAKLTNDHLESLGQPRIKPFFREAGNQDYFDGCLRSEKQGRLTYHYIQIQSERHGLARNWHTYPHTRVNIELERAIQRANELNAWMLGVLYKRYDDRHKR